MRRGRTDISPKEALEIIEKITAVMLRAYQGDLRQEFKKTSRPTQGGYDVLLILLDKKILELGPENRQERIKV